LIGQDCHYCGRPPANYSEGLIYNGIDRVDSREGHYTDNVVPCCGKCNVMKGADSFEVWISHMKAILTHQNHIKETNEHEMA